MRHFKSIEEIKAAEVEELAALLLGVAGESFPDLGAHGLKFLVQHREAHALAVGAGGGAAAGVQQQLQLPAGNLFAVKLPDAAAEAHGVEQRLRLQIEGRGIVGDGGLQLRHGRGSGGADGGALAAGEAPGLVAAVGAVLISDDGVDGAVAGAQAAAGAEGGVDVYHKILLAVIPGKPGIFPRNFRM